MASSLLFSTTLASRLSRRSSPFPHNPLPNKSTNKTPWIKAVASAEPEKEKVAQTAKAEDASSKPVAAKPKKPVFSMKKGQIVRVDKDKYLNSVNVHLVRALQPWVTYIQCAFDKIVMKPIC